MPKEMKFSVAVWLITMLCACNVMAPSKTKYSVSSADKWVGHTVDELIVANGEPSNVYMSGSGGRIFEYLKAPANKKRGDSSQPCKTLFNVSASDIVESWSAEGDKCN